MSVVIETRAALSINASAENVENEIAELEGEREKALGALREIDDTLGLLRSMRDLMKQHGVTVAGPKGPRNGPAASAKEDAGPDSQRRRAGVAAGPVAGKPGATDTIGAS